MPSVITGEKVDLKPFDGLHVIHLVTTAEQFDEDDGLKRVTGLRFGRA